MTEAKKSENNFIANRTPPPTLIHPSIGDSPLSFTLLEGEWVFQKKTFQKRMNAKDITEELQLNLILIDFFFNLIFYRIRKIKIPNKVVSGTKKFP